MEPMKKVKASLMNELPKGNFVTMVCLKSRLSKKLLLLCLRALSVSKFLLRSTVFHSAAASNP